MSATDAASTCPTCGLRLSEGVCPSCALGELFSGSGSLPAGAAGGGETLDVEFGRYVLRSKLATGGMGVVYVAEDAELKRTVALKMVRGAGFAGEGELARFRIEAEAAAGLDHPNIVPIYEVGQSEGQPFYTMKLVDGESLAARLKRTPGGRLGALEVAALMAPIARAVQHAHRHGVLHRDLKPGNVLIDATGVPWLTDFGLAKVTEGDSGLTLTTDHLGTPNYMSPEVVGGTAREVSTASDIWALGVMLWEALCGEAPFAGANPVETMRRIRESEPAVPKGVSADADLLTLAQRCMEKDAARRPLSAGLLADELERKLRGEPLLVRRVTAGERLVKWAKRKPARAGLAAAVTVGLLSSASLWWKVETTEHSLSEAEVMWSRALALSQATQLAIEARAVVGENPARALLLAVESLDRGEQALGEPLPESAAVLFETLQQVGGRDLSPRGVRVKEQDDAWVSRSAAEQYRPRFSPDGRWCLTLDPKGAPPGTPGVQAGVFELGDQGSKGKVAEGQLWRGGGGRSDVVWLDDSTGLVAVAEDGVVTHWVPDLAGRDGRGVVERDLGRVLPPTMELYRVWLRRGDRRRRVEGFALYMGADLEQGDAEHPPRKGFLERFRIEPGEGGLRLVRGELRELPEAIRYYSHWRPSPDFGWLVQADDQLTMLHRLDDRHGVVDGAVMYEGERRYFHDHVDPTGRWLALRESPRRVRLFDLGEGTVAEVVAGGRTLYTHDVQVEVLAFSDDGDKLAVAGLSSEVVMLDLSDEVIEETRFWTEASYVYALGFSGDGKWLAAGSRERTAMLWRLDARAHGAQGTELHGLATAVLGVAFSPDGRNLVATGSGSHFRAWPVTHGGGGSLPGVLATSSSRVTDLVRSADGRWLAASYEAHGQSRGERAGEPVGVGFTKLIDVETGRDLVLGTHDEKATGVAFSPEGRWVASAGRDGLVQVWELEKAAGALATGGEAPAPVLVLDTSMARLEYDRRVAFAPGDLLYCTCGDGALFAWNLNTDGVESEAPSYYPMHSLNYMLPDVEVSRDGRRLAVARHGWDTEPREGATQKGNLVLVFDCLPTGELEQIAELPARFLGETKLHFSADGRWLAAGAAGAGVAVWDLEAADIEGSRREAPVSAQLMQSVAFSPGGEWVAIGVSDGRICLWDWRPESVRRLWTIRTEDSHSCLVWLDETRLASAGAEGEVLVWETNLQKVRELALLIAGRPLHAEERMMLPLAGLGEK